MSRRRAARSVGIVAAVLVLVLAIGWVVFEPIVHWLAHQDVSTKLPETTLDNVRGRLLTLLAGLFAAGALWYTARTFKLTEQGQVTDRYTKAIDHLGSSRLDVRIGGIYALEQVARDSYRDHPIVMDVLSSFIRRHSHEALAASDRNGSSFPERRTRPDIQAAISVIGRRDLHRDIRPIDLNHANLIDAILDYAKLTKITPIKDDRRLIGVYLDHAILLGATLKRANLAFASLSSANLTGADLTGADLRGVILDAKTELTGAKRPIDAPLGWRVTAGLLERDPPLM